MKLALWHVRECASPLARRLGHGLGARVLPEETPDSGFLATRGASNKQQFEDAFPSADAWILLMATGIATRYLAGLPRDKHTDPAVVVVDEACRFAIPVLGGHEGGGNALAHKIANLTGATPVITTATEALKPLSLGIGLRRGVGADRIETAVHAALLAAGGSMEHVREVATVDIKAQEPGLLEWITKARVPLRVFSSSQLSERPLTATPSDWVRSNVGLAGVCEPCALLASPRGRLVVPKLACAGVTVAVVADHPPQNIPGSPL